MVEVSISLNSNSVYLGLSRLIRELNPPGENGFVAAEDEHGEGDECVG